PHGECTRAALALLLGPETEYHMRVRAARRLARQGTEVLPILLKTLSTYPEITSPAWPWWPPQYEHCSRLLIYLSQRAQLGLEDLLHHPASQPAGPVLWASVMEATGLLPHANYEALLCQGLRSPWITVRYAAAMALATKADKVALQKYTIEQLLLRQLQDEALQVQLTIAYALLNSEESRGVDALMQFMHLSMPAEIRKAATFILATEVPVSLSTTQRERLTEHLLHALQDTYTDLALHAAHALSRIAHPSALPAVLKLLDTSNPQTQIVVLTALEEMARHTTMRSTMRRLSLPARVLLFLRSEVPEVRRQASYTLAACGGEYVAAVLGTIVQCRDHPGHVEAIDSLRLLQGVLRAPIRMNVVRWLLRVLAQPEEEIQITALDSLAYLLWQARTHGQKQATSDITQELLREGTVVHLLNNNSAWVRQRSIELLGMLGDSVATAPHLYGRLLHLLYRDNDSGVRACVAYICGQLGGRWAIPGLLQTLLDPDEHVARTALNALSRIATEDDIIVLYVIKELTHLSSPDTDTPHPLTEAGKMALKKWRQAVKKGSRKKLHSSF
ncbi:MAG: HEAT repeat domain-containing protein, partial [Ktedonobacteraceae bacterium]|nr:HEAT repeat domain-containing protein [Ktedonobacteraceae bacterium]